MALFGGSKTDAASSAANSFQWTAEAIALFRAGVRPTKSGDPPRGSVDIVITQRIEARHSWNLDTEVSYFGWVVLEALWRPKGLGRLPMTLTIETKKLEYAPRNSTERKSLDPIGDLYLWKRTEPPHGFEIHLFLDDRRRQAVEQALHAHKSALAPILTLEINEAPAGELDTNLRFPIVAYWLKTLPIDYFGADNHPYTGDELG